MKFQDVLDKGITFSSDNRKLEPHDIADLETLIQAKLPTPYVDYLLHANGGEIDCHFTPNDIDGYASVIHWPKGNGMFDDEEYTIVQYLFDIDNAIYYYKEWKPHLPSNTIVIGTNPGTTFYLLGVGPDNYGKIFAWRLVPVNRMEHPDTAGLAYPGFIADNFIEFLLTLQNIEVMEE